MLEKTKNLDWRTPLLLKGEYRYQVSLVEGDPTPMLQPIDSGLCGQTVLAMIARVTLDEACVAMGASTLYEEGGTYTRQMVRGLKRLGIKVKRVANYSKSKPLTSLPKRAVMAVGDGKTWGHWILLWDGKVYDPGIGTPLPTHIYETYIIQGVYTETKLIKSRPPRLLTVPAYWYISIELDIPSRS